MEPPSLAGLRYRRGPDCIHGCFFTCTMHPTADPNPLYPLFPLHGAVVSSAFQQDSCFQLPPAILRAPCHPCGLLASIPHSCTPGHLDAFRLIPETRQGSQSHKWEWPPVFSSWPLSFFSLEINQREKRNKQFQCLPAIKKNAWKV